MRKKLNCGQQRPLRQGGVTATTHLTGSNIRRPHPAVRQPPLSMRVEGGPDTRAHTRTEGAPPVNKQSWILELGSGWWSCGGMSAMAGGGGAGRLCWKTCYFPFVFWLVSVCGEDRTLMVEVGSMARTHLRAKTRCARKLPAHLDVSHITFNGVRVCAWIKDSRVTDPN